MFTFFQESVIRTLGDFTGKIEELMPQKSKPKYGENAKNKKKRGWEVDRQHRNNF